MKKYKVYKKNGVKVIEEISKQSNRLIFPRPACFKDKTKYNRKRGFNYEY